MFDAGNAVLSRCDHALLAINWESAHANATNADGNGEQGASTRRNRPDSNEAAQHPIPRELGFHVESRMTRVELRIPSPISVAKTINSRGTDGLARTSFLSGFILIACWRQDCGCQPQDSSWRMRRAVTVPGNFDRTEPIRWSPSAATAVAKRNMNPNSGLPLSRCQY